MLSNCLLVHNGNSSLKNRIDKKIEFVFENKKNSDLDKYITESIIPKIHTESFEVLIIKDILSSNPIDYYGIVLLMHIRLSLSIEQKKFIPIIIESNIPADLMNRINVLSNVLFTTNTYLSSADSIEQVLTKIRTSETKLCEENFKELFLDKVSIRIPKDYLSKHSISNEWSIYKWASLLKIQDGSISKIMVNIQSILYFKYLRNRFELYETLPQEDIVFSTNGNAKVLYIDDECHKGWDVIFNKLFNALDYCAIGEDFKDKDSNQIIDIAMAKVDSFKPEVIILDLRLCDSDFDEKMPKELTGSIILKKIKEYNRGIQCIMFTATSRSIYLNYLNQLGIVGYIKKESPEDNLISTTDNITNLNTLTNTAIKNKYLIEVYSLIAQMNSKLNTTLTELNHEEIQILKVNIDFIFSVLNSDANNKLNYAMLTIFKCLEAIKDALTDITTSKVYIKNNGVRNATHSTLNHGQNGYKATRNRLHIILKDKFGFTTTSDEYKEVDYIVNTRNQYIHPNAPDEYTNTIEGGILIWVKILKVFVDGIN